MDTDGVGWAALVIVAIGLLATGPMLVHFGDLREYHHEVTDGPLPESTVERALEGYDDVPEDAVLRYETLSARGQALFLRTLRSPDRQLTLRGAGAGAPAFAYPGHYWALGVGEYYVEYRGEYYRLSTSAETGFPGLAESLLALALSVPGFLLLCLGLVRVDDVGSTVGSLSGVGTVAAASVADFGWFGFTSLVPLVSVGLATALGIHGLVWSLSRVVSSESNSSSRPSEQSRIRTAATCGGAGLAAATILNAVLGVADLQVLPWLAAFSFAVPAALGWHWTDAVVSRVNSLHIG